MRIAAILTQVVVPLQHVPILLSVCTAPCCQAHKVYLEGTEHRTAAFNKLTSGDAGAARVIEQRMKKLIKLQVRRPRWSGPLPYLYPSVATLLCRQCWGFPEFTCCRN